ncbi:MAG: DNA repair protein RecN [Ruminococcaceae bacterium]|nr:DNA repair protein RecN [Oscillospiraceae bacterium]
MLSNLRIENIAIIKEAVIDFRDGFNVMTGETGAGKSIIIDSLNAVLGERTSRELIRTGCEYAEVSALFFDKGKTVSEILSEFDITPESEGEIIISRKMSADGKNICKINGVAVTVSMLKKIGKALVNIHGQSDSQALLNPEFHLGYIDSIADDGKELEDYSASFSEYTDVKNRLAKLNFDEEQKNRRLDMLNFQINEIESAGIREGEYDELKEKQSFYRNSEKLSTALLNAYEALNGNSENEGAVSLSFASVNSLKNCSGFSESTDKTAELIENSAYSLSEASDEIKDLLEKLDFDESDVNAVEERLDVIYNLSRKYGKTESDILKFYDEAVKERDSIENADTLKAELENKLSVLFKECSDKAEKLSAVRKEAGDSFCKNVCKELEFLNMPSVKFFVDFKKCELNETGADSVEFFLSANLGEEPKPLHKIASGGELARIMLAIKNVLAEKDEIATLVFDEIDTGVSGSAAQKIAVKLKSVSQNHQVICVTHLASIAAYADEHMYIEKQEKDGKTFTSLTSLDYDGRVNELARIMGGATVSEAMLAGARQLLNEAGIDG